MAAGSVYLDYNATTPVDPRVVEHILPFFTEKFGNAASTTHPYGWQAEKAVDLARKELADLAGCIPQEIVFTSGATESINLALKGVFENYRHKKRRIISAETEHKAVLDTLAYLEDQGAEIIRLRTDAQGILSPESVKEALTGETLLVCIMLSNNETGVIHDIAKIADYAHEAGAMMMSDATQAVGKIPVDVNALGIDIMPLSAHKMYGPKGVGALYLRRRSPRVVPAPLIHGGGHERGFRSGTLNVPGIAGLGRAAAIAAAEMTADAQRIGALRDRLEQQLLEIPGTSLNGHPEKRMFNVSNISFAGVDGEKMVMGMSEIAVSTGSACTSAKPEPSHVLAAMGVPDELAYSSIRFSPGKFTSPEDIDTAVSAVKRFLGR